MTLKPVCIPCQRFFRMQKSIFFLEQMPLEADAKRGNSESHKWKPYKLWSGDIWKCQGCGAEIISGFGTRPIAEHFQPKFAEEMERLGPIITVNDC